MNKLEIPPVLLPLLVMGGGKVMSLNEYLQLLRENRGLVDYPVVDRKIGIVISRPLAHRNNVALLGACHEMFLNSPELLSEKGEDFWVNLRSMCEEDDLARDSLVEKFVKAGGYFFSSASAPRVICVCLCGRHMDDIDHEIHQKLNCRGSDYPYG